MARALTMRHLTVPSAREAEYLATIAALAKRHAERGQHLWVFRARDDAGAWLEFSEGPDDATHRAAGPVDADEARLEAALAGIAHYHDDEGRRWDEVRPAAS